jgi:hypothetical protein
VGATAGGVSVAGAVAAGVAVGLFGVGVAPHPARRRLKSIRLAGRML